MEKEILIYVDFQGVSELVGRLWTRSRQNKESATFEYDKNWLKHPNRFSIDPLLTLGPGPFHARSGQLLFGSIGESAPDRWGRTLMRRAERRRVEHLNETPRTLQETDYLLMVNDEARQGALRFKLHAEGEFLAPTTIASIPPLLDLPQLLSAMSMLSASDNETRSYLEIADVIRQLGSCVKEDLHELWRRMVFNILISNGY